MGDFRIAQKRRTRNDMGSSSTNNQAEHQSSKVLLYGSLKSMKRSFTISVDQPWCFTLQLSGLEHCLSPASSQGRRRVPAGDLQGSSQRRCTRSGAANADLFQCILHCAQDAGVMR
ncbi:uncharacterized protein ACIBXB_000170 isoform 2-T2 [Morphnus guianensis]